MNDDLEYFSEFLENPSAPDINEFFRLVRRWATYIGEHQDEFNYLQDDEWAEIRERLLDELEIRVPIKDELEFEFDEINTEIENLDKTNHDRAYELFNRRLELMKIYNYIFDISDEVIIEFEEKINEFSTSMKEARQADENLRIKQMELNISIAELDDGLAQYYERTGKVPILPAYPDKKVHKGN